ncbi:MAG: hypothetical protein AAF512_24420, partial [Pseudomonadota bacterium]
MTTDQLSLYRHIDEILFYKWDPIGVSDIDLARDEYQSYVPQLFQMALAGHESDYIASELSVIVKERMGLNPSLVHNRRIAELILGA